MLQELRQNYKWDAIIVGEVWSCDYKQVSPKA